MNWWKKPSIIRITNNKRYNYKWKIVSSKGIKNLPSIIESQKPNNHPSIPSQQNLSLKINHPIKKTKQTSKYVLCHSDCGFLSYVSKYV